MIESCQEPPSERFAMTKRHFLFFLLCGLLITATACQAADPTETPTPIIETEETLPEPTQTMPEPAASPTPTLAPTSTPEPSPTPRTILRQDDFSDVSSGWERYQQFDGVLDYVIAEETYQMNVLAEESLWYVWLEEDLADVVFSVDTWQAAGPEDTLYGILCRFDADLRNGVVFLISGQGQAAVGLMEDNFQPLPGGALTQFDAIQTGLNVKNSIEARCVGERLIMSVNSERLFELPSPGSIGNDIGLVVRTSAGAADIRFDNLTLYAP